MTTQTWTGVGFTDGAAITTANSGGAAGDALTITLVSPGTAVAEDTNPPITGYRWCKLTNAGGTGERARAWHVRTATLYNQRWYQQIPTDPAATVTIAYWLLPTTFSTAASLALVSTGGIRRLRFQDNSGTVLCDWGAITYGTGSTNRYMVDSSVTSGATGAYEIRVYDSTGTELTPTSGSRTGTGNFGTTGFERMVWGTNTTSAFTLQVSGIKGNDGPTAALIGAAASNVAPVATVMSRPDPQEPGTATVTGTVTDSDGTVASVAVTILSGPDNPTVSVSTTGLNTASCSVTATFAAAAGARYVVRLTGTDNSGAAANNSDVIIDTYSTGGIPVYSEVSTTGFATLTGAADGVTAMNDGLTTSYRETASAPAAAEGRWQMCATRTGVDAIVRPDLFLNGATPITASVKLYKEDNTTQVGSTQNLSVPTGGAIPSVTFTNATMNSAGLTAASSRRALIVSISCTQ